MIGWFDLAPLLLPVALAGATFVFFLRTGWRRRWPPLAELITGNLLILSVLVSALLAIGEVYYRVIYDTTDSFATALTTQRWLKRHVTVNSWNFRDDVEYAFARNSKRPRVTFFGDSFTVGHGVADVSDRYLNRIRAAKPGWEVHGLAKNGLNTRTALDLIRIAVNDGYELDTVILAYCLNDATESSVAWPDKWRALEAELRPKNFLTKTSFLANALHFRSKRRSPELQGYFEDLQLDYRGESWVEMMDLFAAFETTVGKNSGTLLVVVFPFFHVMGPEYPYRKVHDKVVSFWRARGIRTLDLLEIYVDFAPEQLVVNSHDPHPNELAHAMAAGEIESFIERALNSNASR